jgi:hypothetical protein
VTHAANEKQPVPMSFDIAWIAAYAVESPKQP